MTLLTEEDYYGESNGKELCERSTAIEYLMIPEPTRQGPPQDHQYLRSASPIANRIEWCRHPFLQRHHLMHPIQKLGATALGHIGETKTWARHLIDLRLVRHIVEPPRGLCGCLAK